MDFPTSELWNYSTQIWTLPEVEAICLILQDNYDANVNILLYCCWIGDKNLSLNDDDLQTIIDTVQPWQTIIKPLRDSRKMMKQQLIALPASLIEQTVCNITEMEINAEHMTQLALEKVLLPESISTCDEKNSIKCSLNNLKAYLSSLDNISSADELLPQISQLLSAIFQDEEAVQMAMMSDI
ncbi:MAG: TIGR02444 family protein [Gammaproteobacteria bacterium]|nr:TIGR02444 family protein [Gammaproteobacteria bacterium]